MASVRHRRRLTAVRALAVLTPVLTVVGALVAFLLGGDWPLLAASIGVAASIILGTLAFRLDRRLRVEIATVRADQAAEYADEHGRYADEHREFTNHMVGLLDVAGERIDSMRGQLNRLEVEIAYSRSTRPGASTPSTELAQLAEGAEWNDLWPDLSDAPTVVDLVAWDEKNRTLLPEATAESTAALDEPEERTA
ncbi:hypothetical protein [Phytoactinopolyspora limicola]|uniref:hypothetical protein n=1 Tax=Phytoactinopolyspora limicola TaxID=2715536 RepID=UPI00140BB938|nr:hypothetical protein [Phytoactinopolyspora limicola]